MDMAEKLGAGPERKQTRLGDGRWRIEVTPPRYTGGTTQTVVLTQNQYERYQIWRRGDLLIQDAFPDLDPDTRELLKTGLTTEDFARLFGEERDEEES